MISHWPVSVREAKHLNRMTIRKKKKSSSTQLWCCKDLWTGTKLWCSQHPQTLLLFLVHQCLQRVVLHFLFRPSVPSLLHHLLTFTCCCCWCCCYKNQNCPHKALGCAQFIKKDAKMSSNPEQLFSYAEKVENMGRWRTKGRKHAESISVLVSESNPDLISTVKGWDPAEGCSSAGLRSDWGAGTSGSSSWSRQSSDPVCIRGVHLKTDLRSKDKSSWRH